MRFALVLSLGSFGLVQESAACSPTTTIYSPSYSGPHAAVVADREDAVVTFIDPDEPRTYKCSGTLIDEDLVLTATHCINDVGDFNNYEVLFEYEYRHRRTWTPWGGGRVVSVLNSGTSYPVADIVERGSDAFNNDYAIVRISGSPAADLGITPTPVRAWKPGTDTDVIVIGHPRKTSNAVDSEPRPKSVGTGEVFGFGTFSNGGTPLLRYDINAHGGMSGAGILDTEGHLIGVHNAFADEVSWPAGEANCAYGDAGSLIADVQHVSDVLRDFRAGVSLYPYGNATSYGSLSVSCESGAFDQTRRCDRAWGSGSTFLDLEEFGCTAACPAGATVTVSCSVSSGSSSSRDVEEINRAETTVLTVGSSYSLGANARTTCGGDTCSTTFTATGEPVIASCEYTD